MLLAFNTLQWALREIQRHTQPASIPFHSLGFKFIGLEKLFKNQRYVGYYTDKNLDAPLAIAQFEQAQYMLSPTVLDLNNTHYFYTIFDCTTPQVALEKIKSLKLRPVKMNNFGIIVTVNPRVQ